MAVRDIVIFAIVFGALPFAFWRPYIGVLLWTWLAYMNPHRLSWGLAYDFPFSQIVAIVTLIGITVTRSWRPIPSYSVVVIWATFFMWTIMTTLTAVNAKGAAEEWGRWWKINLLSFVMISVMQSRRKIELMALVIAVSLGFYGVKGGIFGIATGGRFMVLGPPGSFIEGNTVIGLALIMVLPLIGFLWLEAKNRWAKLAAAGSMILTAVAIIATSSRGALLGLVAMTVFLAIKSRRLIQLGIVSIVFGAVTLSVMPQAWFDRMGTIIDYEQDGSAMGRINAWWFAFNLAVDKPILAGGFNTFIPRLFRQYAPEPDDFHDAHSIYFEVLAEQGFIGLALFLALGITAYRTGSWIIRRCGDRQDLDWARNLAGMLQTSIVGYAVCGAFLGHAYFDFYYNLIVLLILTRYVVERELYSPTPVADSANAAPDRGGSAGGAGQ